MISTEVLVCGGGPVGLTAAALLGRLGIRTLVVERRAEASQHPRAHVVQTRSMEVLRSLDVADEVRRHALPLWAVGFVSRLDGLELGSVHLHDFPEHELQILTASPEVSCSRAQDEVESILRAAVAREPLVEVRYGASLERFEQDANGVTAVVRDAGGEQHVHADYLIAADGANSPARSALGIEAIGPGNHGSMLGIYFHANLDKQLDERPFLITWVANSQVQGGLVALNGIDRWVFHTALGEVAADDHEGCLGVLRAAIGDDVSFDIRSVRVWNFEVGIAERFRAGRVFLAGDAAHKFPPMGGLGMNTGIGDVHNLCWKLALVLRGHASGGLLDSYEDERLPVAEANAEHSMENSRKMARAGFFVLDPAALADIEAPEGAEQRSRMRAAIPDQHPQLFCTGQDLGYQYQSSAVLPDGSDPTPSTATRYLPSARPGARAPHCWLVRSADGAQVSTIDLFDRSFTLLAGPHGQEWCTAAAVVAGQTGLPLAAFRVGAGGDLLDPSGSWATMYGVSDDGAVLVRPDGHVAWRAQTIAGNPTDQLRSVITAFTGSIDVATGARS